MGFYPFADFSPEWQAIRYALEHQKEVHFIDLTSDHPDFSEKNYVPDPLRTLAEASQFDDTENWWDHHFEQGGSKTDLWDSIIELIQAIRPSEASAREIFMCQQIKKHHKKDQHIAVICGAWHAPILRDWPTHSKGSVRSWKTSAHYYWVPWTYHQLSESAGYGAGVKAPLYYDYLWRHNEDPSSFWFTSAAHVFRKNGLDVSTAHLIEASRMSINLAHLRGRSNPGLHELWDSIQSVFPSTERNKWSLLKKSIWIGERIGKVDASINDLPLINDFYQKMKRFRLSKYLEASDVDVKRIDLRKPFHLEMSRFLHQCRAMGLEWPRQVEAETLHRGTFNEYWDLEIDFVVDAILIEHAHKGHTVRDAALFQVRSSMTSTASTVEMINLLEGAMNAHLEEEMVGLVELAHERVTEEGDGVYLLRALMKLHRILTFGNVIERYADDLWALWEYLHVKLYIHLEEGLLQLAEEEVPSVLSSLKSFHLTEAWKAHLWRPLVLRISANPKILPPLRGLACRILLDLTPDQDELERRLAYEWSRFDAISDTTQWLEGFMSTGRIDLLEHHHILPHIHRWISQIGEVDFDAALISLRKTFSIFSEQEKKQILDIIFHERQGQNEENTESLLFLDLYTAILGETPSV